MLRIVCWCVFLCVGLGKSLAQTESAAEQTGTEATATTTPIAAVSSLASDNPATAEAQSDEMLLNETPDKTSTPEELVSPVFQLPLGQHPWGRFQPGAWRELRIVSETFDDMDQVVSRSITTQKEVLQAIAEGKYVLDVQATVELGGKRIVGESKTRILHIETDGAGALVESLRLQDQEIRVAGRSRGCQVWEVRYQEGSQNLTDRIFYDAKRFPFVLQRETFANTSMVGSAKTKEDLVNKEPIDGPKEQAVADEEAVEIEQLTELTAHSLSYPVGEELFDCSCLRTILYRTKGDTLRLTFVSPAVPGGELAILSSDYDAEGQRVRSSVAQLVGYGEIAPEGETISSTTANRNDQP